MHESANMMRLLWSEASVLAWSTNVMFVFICAWIPLCFYDHIENLTPIGYCNIYKIATIVDHLYIDRQPVHGVTTSSTTSDNEWQQVMQRLTTTGTTCDKEWQQMATKGKKWGSKREWF